MYILFVHINSEKLNLKHSCPKKEKYPCQKHDWGKKGKKGEKKNARKRSVPETP